MVKVGGGSRAADLLQFGHCGFQIQPCYGHNLGPVLLLVSLGSRDEGLL